MGIQAIEHCYSPSVPFSRTRKTVLLHLLLRTVILAMLHAVLFLSIFLPSNGMEGYTENCDGECVSSCKPYWVEIQSHCYFWSKIQLNWAEAEATCRKQGGHLASITSKATNDRVSNETERSHKDHKSMWIGGTDTEEEAVYRWSDCEEGKFELLTGIQPKKYDCVEFFKEGKFWGDNDCAEKNYFLCSQKLCPGSMGASVGGIIAAVFIVLAFIVCCAFKCRVVSWIQGRTS